MKTVLHGNLVHSNNDQIQVYSEIFGRHVNDCRHPTTTKFTGNRPKYQLSVEKN